METKKCKSCGRELPIDNFRVAGRNPDVRVDVCKECINAKRKSSKIAPSKNSHQPYTDPRFAQFEGRELIAELRRRGYKGKLYYTNEITL